MRLIDADVFVECIEEDIERNLCLCDEEDDDYDKLCTAISIARGFIAQIEKRPTVEAKPVVHGSWETEFTALLVVCRCSECNCATALGQTNFCPNCGADMRGEKHD